MGFRRHGSKDVPESAREVFLAALGSGVSQSAAATVAGVSHTTGHRWAKAAGITPIAGIAEFAIRRRRVMRFGWRCMLGPALRRPR